MTTPILAIDEVSENQNDKEITVNDAINALEAASNDWVSLDFTSGNISMTSGTNLEEFRRNVLLKAVNNSVARDLTLPANKRLFVVWNFGSATLSVKLGSTTITVAAGDKAIFYADGTTDGLTSIVGGSGFSVAASSVTFDNTQSPDLSYATEDNAQQVIEQLDYAIRDLADSVSGIPGSYAAEDISYAPVSSPGPDAPVPSDVRSALDYLFDTIQRIPVGIPLSIPGKPGAGAIYNIMMPFAIRVMAGLDGSKSYSGTNATSSSAFSLSKNGAASFGTITFTSGSSTGARSAASATEFAAGDRLTITAPGSQDATLANVGITLYAVRI